MSVHTFTNPFAPRASVARFPNGVFEIRLHVQGVASDVQLVPHDNYVLITGKVSPRAHIDANGTTSKVLWADYPSGYFGRDIQLRISPNTTIVVLERRQESDGLVIRYTLRPKLTIPRGVVYPQIDAFSTSGVHQPVANNVYNPYDYNFNSTAFVNQHWASHGGVPTSVNQPVYGPVSSSLPQAYTYTTAGPFVSNGATAGVESNAHLNGHVGLHAGPVNLDVNGGLSANFDSGITLENVQPLI